MDLTKTEVIVILGLTFLTIFFTGYFTGSGNWKGMLFGYPISLCLISLVGYGLFTLRKFNVTTFIDRFIDEKIGGEKKK